MDKKDLANLRNKPKEFIPPDSYQIGTEVGMLRKAGRDLVDVIHRMTTVQQLHISKVRGQMAVRLISRAVRVVLAFKDNRYSRTLSDKERDRVVSLIEDVLNGKRQAVQFQSTLDGTGIVELFSNEVIHAEEDEILKL